MGKQFKFDAKGRPIIDTNATASAPEYKADLSNPNPPPPDYMIAVASTFEDQVAIADLTGLPVPQEYQNTVNAIQSDNYAKALNTQPDEDNNIFKNLDRLFGQYEIPAGLMNKLIALQGTALHFKIDDSSSMTNDSNLLRQDISPYMQNVVKNSKNPYVSRWEEAEDRLHRLVDFLAYVPTGPIMFSRFDRGNIKGEQKPIKRNQTPDDFKITVHKMIREIFSTPPTGNTPIYDNMYNMSKDANELRGKTDLKVNNYIITDGEPSGGSIEIRKIKNFLKNRLDPSKNTFTYLGCSNLREDYEWMHEMEEIARFVAAINDYKDEREEVRKIQPNFLYNRGMWMLCNLVAANNQNDLDAINEFPPLTKPTMESLYGRGMPEEEYRYYFETHSCGANFDPEYKEFVTQQWAADIKSVKIFNDELRRLLDRDMDRGEDDTEAEEEKIALQAVDNYMRKKYGYSASSSNLFSSSTRYSGTMYGNSNAQRSQMSYSNQPVQDKDSGCKLM